MTTTPIVAREAELRQALSENQNDVDGLMALADWLAEQDRDRDAAEICRRVLVVNPEHGAALCKLGVILHAYRAFRLQAIALLEQALAIDAALIDAYRPLAWSLAQIGRREVSVAVLRVWTVMVPTDPVAAHLLAAYSAGDVPGRASDEFVRHTADQGAEHFDSMMRESLKYCAPEVLYAQLATLLPQAGEPNLDILDMGCGTGLCSPLLRPIARRLVGVDLSTKMLEKARQRALYDQLERSELTTYLAECGEHFDGLFATDTLVYFGHLGVLFAHAYAALRPGGWIAFTVEKLQPGSEKCEPPVAFDVAESSCVAADIASDVAAAAVPTGVRDFVLDTTGRYQHCQEYVASALASVGFVDLQIIEAQIRIDDNEPIIGLAVVAKKSASIAKNTL